MKDREIEGIYDGLPRGTRGRVDTAINAICQVKRDGGRICVLTGSGPNLHEGVTTLVAGLIRVGLVDGVLTSSAVVAHEMAGCLERVHRVDGSDLGIDPELLPADGRFEVSLCDEPVLMALEREMEIDRGLLERALEMPGDRIIKAAGNMAYPLGLRTEIISREIGEVARSRHSTFEEIAGLGSDPRTMIGASSEKEVPVLVTVPQLVGGGSVGIEISESTPMRDRSRRIAQLLSECDLVIESALALAQEVHDGPLETYTGHGIWSGWLGDRTYRLEDKQIIRIDLDPNLEVAWAKEREAGSVKEAITKGLPKTKVMGIPFRMEMSGFARVPRSLPIVGDIGRIWPVIASRVDEELGVGLDFMSYPQETGPGQAMRDWIADEIRVLDRDRMMAGLGV
jgi:hypothetical protein